MMDMSSVSHAIANEPAPAPGPVERAPDSSLRGAARKEALLGYFASPSREMREMDAAWEEALSLYGDEDSDAWVAALEDGTHPLCRIRTTKRSP